MTKIAEKSVTGVDTIYHLGNGDGTLMVERKQDCQPILDEVRKIKDHTNGKSKTGDIYHIGRIPSVIVEGYCNLRGITFNEFITNDTHVDAIMNDPDYKQFRIWEGSV